jgi:hypothetical protein
MSYPLTDVDMIPYLKDENKVIPYLKDENKELRAEIERLRAANKKLMDILKETPCETNGTDVGECLESKSCCCAIADYAD